MSAYCCQASRFQLSFRGNGCRWRPRWVALPIFTLGHDKCVSSYQWILHVDWWVDFVYFTNLKFSMEIYVYLYNDNVIQHSFYVNNNIDQVPGWLFCLVSGAPTFVSRHHLLFKYWR